MVQIVLRKWSFGVKLHCREIVRNESKVSTHERLSRAYEEPYSTGVFTNRKKRVEQ